jgi:hypothetical protein
MLGLISEAVGSTSFLMADHKNQHFVPRVHLKPFSIDGRAKAVNLFLISKGRPIFGAPVKGQCSRDYLYGEDGFLEKRLSRIEGRYAAMLRALSEPSHLLDGDDRFVLRYSTLLQSLRTFGQIERVLEMMRKIAGFMRRGNEAHGQGWDPADDPTQDQAMMALMQGFKEQVDARLFDDLKVVILHNKTGRDFVTSDDPAVTTNRWMLQRKRMASFGTSAAGLVMIMPLGPRMVSMIYDPAVYAVNFNAVQGILDITKEADVLALNEHQYIRAQEAVYFRRPEEAELIARDFETAKPYRLDAWDTFNVARADGGTTTHKRYVVGDPEELAGADDVIMHSARGWPTPSRWPSFLKMRSTAHGFTQGRTIIRRAVKEAGAGNFGPYHKVS